MRTSLVLTVTGVDKPGLVDLLSSTLTRFEANWEESRMAHLAGRFVGILKVSLPVGRVDTLVAALGQLEGRGLVVRADRGLDAAAVLPSRLLRLDLVGNDREGIVRDVAHALAQRQVNVEELETSREDAPEGGQFLFRINARLSAPADLDLGKLRAALEGIGNELMVDISLADDAT